MPPKIRRLVGWNFRQALFKAAGLSEDSAFGQRALLWVLNGVFLTRRSGVPLVPLRKEPSPHPNARLLAVFECGHLIKANYRMTKERKLWPSYPWKDADVLKEAVKAGRVPPPRRKLRGSKNK
jgi:hypothetical protein